MQLYLLIALGGALGSVTRFWLNGLVSASAVGATFPLGTLLINISGSFAIGFFSTLTGPDGRWLIRQEARQFFMVGICGGYTTFSSFSLQTLSLVQHGEMLRAGANVGGSVIGCLVAVWLGHVCAAALNQLR